MFIALIAVVLMLSGCLPFQYFISGYTKDSSGNPISGVTISFSNGSQSAVTNSNGHWSKNGLSGQVTVTPSLSGYTFSPPSKTVSSADSNVNFTGTENVNENLIITQRWNLTTNGTPTAGQVYSSPAISSNSVVFIGDQQGLFFDFSSSGNYYYFQSELPVWSAPTIDYQSNVVFVGNNKGQLTYSHSPFSYPATAQVSIYPIISAPLVYNGNVYVVDHAGDIYEMSESSMSPYKIGAIGGNIWSSPVTNGTDMFIGSDNGTFYAMNLSDGSINWHHQFDDPIYGTAAIDSNGNIYIGGTKLWSFTSTGSVRWSKQLDGSQIYGSPVISSDGMLYIGTVNGNFYAINSQNGSILWSKNLSTSIGGISSSAIIGDNGVVYVVSGQTLYALDHGNGNVLSLIGLGYNVESNPVMNGGYIYIGCDDGYLYQIKTLSSAIASHGWPMFMKDQFHSGM